jgi:hypothetical protein
VNFIHIEAAVQLYAASVLSVAIKRERLYCILEVFFWQAYPVTSKDIGQLSCRNTPSEK